MAEFATIARPYAKALFGLAQEKNQIESWLGELKQLVSVVQQDKVLSLIEQPEIGSSEKVGFISNLIGLRDDNLKNFLYVMAEYKRLPVLPEVYAQYKNLTLGLGNTKSAVIYSAYELGSSQLAELTADLKHRFGANLEITTVLSPELIGGVKVEVGDQVLDLSVQGKLNSLYAAMTN